MRKISFQNDIGIDALYQLITSHITHGFYIYFERKPQNLQFYG
jgi:hypothetical protein